MSRPSSISVHSRSSVRSAARPHSVGDVRLDAAGDTCVLSGFGRPFGLRVDAEGRLYIADMDLQAVFRLSADWRTIEHLDVGAGGWSDVHPVAPGTAPRRGPRDDRPPVGPHSVEIAPDGHLFVTTYYVPGVRVFSEDGALQAVIGDRSSGRPLEGPATAFFDSIGRLLVAEYRQHALLAWSEDGDYLGALGRAPDGRTARFDAASGTAASAAPGGFDRLHMGKQAPDGTLVVVDTWNHRLQRFASDGQWLGWLGQGERTPSAGWRNDDPPRAGSAPEAFSAPVAVDFHDGLMLVTDWGNNRLQLFDLDGRLVEVRDELGLSRPYDACFLGDRIVAADSHHGRLVATPLDKNSVIHRSPTAGRAPAAGHTPDTHSNGTNP